MAYNLKYNMKFLNVAGDLYEVQILLDGYTGAVTELTGSGSPFSVEYNQEDKLYNPLRFAGATIGVVGFNNLSGLYSNNYHQHKVNVYRGTELIYTGFVYPEQFSIPNNGYEENVGIECVSALATLDNVPFSSDLHEMTLFALLKDAVQKSRGDYRYIYIPLLWFEHLNHTSLQDVRISTANFFDEKGEPMSYKEILEEIAKLFSITITEKNGNIYLIDIDYIKGQHDTYFQYNAAMTTHTVLRLSNSKQIISDAQSRGNNNTYSMIPSYSKVTVLASDYEIEDGALFPELDTKDLKAYHRAERIDRGIQYYKDYFLDEGTRFTTFRYRYDEANKVYIPGGGHGNMYEVAGGKVMSRANYDTRNKPSRLNWEDWFEIKLFDMNKNGRGVKFLDGAERINLNGDMWVNSFELDFRQYPVLKAEQSVNFVIDQNYKMALSLDIQYFDDATGFVRTERKNNNDTISSRILVYGRQYWAVLAQIKLGDYYYNGASWTTNPNDYVNMQVNITDDTHFTFDIMQLEDQNTFEFGVPDLSGYIIHFDRPLSGKFEVTFYVPRQAQMDYAHAFIFLRNIKVEAQRIDHSKNRNKQDTLYTNIISNEFLSEAEDIEVKITSLNESELSLSKIYNGTGIIDKVPGLDGQRRKPEELIIDRFVNQYQRPKVKLSEETLVEYTPYQMIVLQSLPGKDFIMTGEVIDYMRNKSEITMIELD